MQFKPIPPFNVPIAAAYPGTEPWIGYFASLDQRVRSDPTFPVGETSIVNATGVTLTAAQLLGGLLLRSGPAGAFSDTTPTATQIIAAILKADIGINRLFAIQNSGGGVMTLLAGTGVTLSGTTTIASNFTRFYLASVTGLGASAAVTIRGVMTGAK